MWFSLWNLQVFYDKGSPGNLALISALKFYGPWKSYKFHVGSTSFFIFCTTWLNTFNLKSFLGLSVSNIWFQFKALSNILQVSFGHTVDCYNCGSKKFSFNFYLFFSWGKSVLPTVMFFIYSWQYSKSAFLVLPLSLSKMRKFLPNWVLSTFTAVAYTFQ